MTLAPWDIDQFPMKTGVRQTPGQQDADRFLREVQPGDLDRLTREHQDDPSDRFFGVPTSGGGHVDETYTNYPSSGHYREDRSYEDPTGEYGHLPGEPEPSRGYYMPGITHPFDDDDDDQEHRPTEYHVATGHVDSHDPSEWTEHNYTMFEHPDADYDPDSAWDYFQQDHPEYNPERNINATHEVKHVHPIEHHDTWHNQLRSEGEDFDRISQHGFERESPDIPGHRAYTHTDPHGGKHRLWHNQTTFINEGPSNATHGPGWRTSYHNPELSPERQIPWSFHDDDTPGDSLGDALAKTQRNKIHADVTHSGTGLKTVENSYGHHYVSTRADGSTQQLLRNHGYADEPNWGVTYYPQTGMQHMTSQHGGDLAGALDQARRNLAKG